MKPLLREVFWESACPGRALRHFSELVVHSDKNSKLTFVGLSIVFKFSTGSTFPYCLLLGRVVPMPSLMVLHCYCVTLVGRE